MRKRERRGWTLAVLLACLILIVAVPIAHTPTHKQSKITNTEVTWKVKNENRKTARTYARIGFGWSGKQWHCLNSLWTSESRYSHLATNPTSSARGIAQMLGESSSDPRIQILRGLRYIDKRYGSPCKAYSFHLRHHFY